MLIVAMLFGAGLTAMFAEGAAEGGPVTSLVLAVENDWDINSGAEGTKEVLWYRDIVAAEFFEATGIEVRIVKGVTGNEPTPVKSRVMAGEMPNVYADYAGRIGQFSPLALNLEEYLSPDIIGQYFPSYIEMLTRARHVFALPLTSWSTVGHVNLDAFKAAYMPDVLEDGIVTYDEVYTAAKRLQSDGYFAAPIFAAGSGGGDYWLYTYWLAGHGAKLYNDDGTVAVNSPEGIEALTMMKAWYDEGLIAFGAAGLEVGDFINQINTGKMITYSFGMGAVGGREWNDVHTTTPRVSADIKQVPVATGPDAVMAFDTGTDAERQASAQLVKWIASRQYQDARVQAGGRFPSMYGVELPEDIDPNMEATIRVTEENGVMNMGMATLWYGAMRLEWMSLLQAIFSEDETVEDAIAIFERNGNRFIIEALNDPLRFLSE